MNSGKIVTRSGRLFARICANDKLSVIVPIAGEERHRQSYDVPVSIMGDKNSVAVCSAAHITTLEFEDYGLQLADSDLAACISAVTRHRRETQSLQRFTSERAMWKDALAKC